MTLRKQRTREHIIADLSVNHLERFILRQGHTAERQTGSDYGYDLVVSTYDGNGERETGIIFVQLKATDSPRFLEQGKYLAWTLDLRDLRLWLGEAMPVILVVYDAPRDESYWLYVQEYFRATPLPTDQATYTVRVPVTNKVTEVSIEELRQLKSRINTQIAEAIKTI